MKTKTLTPGDKVSLTTKEKIWKGNILESYDSEIILLKLESGYNIGIRENEVLDVKVLEKVKPIEKKEIDFEIGAARMSLKSARSLLNLMG